MLLENQTRKIWFAIKLPNHRVTLWFLIKSKAVGFAPTFIGLKSIVLLAKLYLYINYN